MAVLLAKVWYTNYGNGSNTGHYALAQWATGTSYTVGQIIRQLTTPTVGNERCFICIVAGTSHASTEPTWTVTKGAKNTDNTVTWQECTGMPAVNADQTNTPLSSQNRSGVMPLGQIIQNNAGTYYFICSTSGTTGAGEPTYNLTAGVTTTDSSCTWTCLGTVGSYTTKWGAPHARINSNNGTNYAASGDTWYVSSIHAETGIANITCSPGSATAITKVLCVANGGTIPPTSADITTGATISTTGSAAGSWTLNGLGTYWQGITWSIGTSTSAFGLTIASATAVFQVFKNCAVTFGGSSSQQLLVGSGARSSIIFDNWAVTFNGQSGSSIAVGGGHFVWKNTASALAKASTNWPTTLFIGTGSSGDFLFQNVDLSAFNGTNFIAAALQGGNYVFKDCKLPSLTLSAQTQTQQAAERFDFINCDTAGAIYNHARYWYEGQQTVTTAAVRSGGATDGTTSYSWKVVTGSNSQWFDPFQCLPIMIWNTTTAANRTVTIEAAYVGTALPNTDDIWIDVNYYGTASSTLGTCNTTTKSNILATGSAWSSSTASWGGSASARANSHAYALGDLIGVSSASSITRLFHCTTAGTSSGSLPGAYASATDGSQVTDGTAVMTAVERFQLTTTLSTPQPQSAGYFTIYVNAAKVSSTFYVDPVATLS